MTQAITVRVAGPAAQRWTRELPKQCHGEAGLSTANTPGNLPLHRRDSQFGGTGKDPVWQMHTDQLPDGLIAVNDHDDHEDIHRSNSDISDSEFTRLLEETQPNWKRCK